MNKVSVSPIRNNDELKAALKRAEEIFFAKHGTPEHDELEVLSILITAYEKDHFAGDPTHPVEAIKFYMDQRALSDEDMVQYLGTRSRVSEVLNCRRALTMEMVRKLNEGLGIPLESLTQAYELTPYNRESAKRGGAKTARTIKKRSGPSSESRTVRPGKNGAYVAQTTNLKGGRAKAGKG